MKVNRCNKCWETGHKKWECKSPERKDLCIRCGKERHRAKECEDELECLIYHQRGHALTSMRCPKMRKAVKERETPGNAEKGQIRRRTSRSPYGREANQNDPNAAKNEEGSGQ